MKTVQKIPTLTKAEHTCPSCQHVFFLPTLVSVTGHGHCPSCQAPYTVLTIKGRFLVFQDK